MSAAHENDNDELIDYEEENDAEVPAMPTATNGSATPASNAVAATGEVDKEKKGYVGVHSTGFRFVDCGDVQYVWGVD